LRQSNTDGNGDSYSYANGYGYSDGNVYADGNSDTDYLRDAYSYCGAEGDADATAASYAASTPISPSA
jgi:hypothetical protein